MSTNAKPKVRSIPEGKGGTFSTKKPSYADVSIEHNDSDWIPQIGTSGVKTCVGVYFKVSDTRCFVAHINGYIECEGEKLRSRECTEEEGLRFKKEIMNKIATESEKHDWSLQEVSDSLIIVCAEPAKPGPHGSLVAQSGMWIINGIREFLKCEDAQFLEKTGFVVNLENEHVQTLTYIRGELDVGIPAAELEDYELRPEPSENTQDWVIGVERKR